MLDKEKLSKQKYIYSIYASSDDVLHVEKYPVIYINNKYVYYKMTGRDDLVYHYTHDVKDDIFSLRNMNLSLGVKRFFWNADCDFPETYKELKEKFATDKFMKEKAYAKNTLELAKAAYEKAMKDYEKYEKGAAT